MTYNEIKNKIKENNEKMYRISRDFKTNEKIDPEKYNEYLKIFEGIKILNKELKQEENSLFKKYVGKISVKQKNEIIEEFKYSEIEDFEEFLKEKKPSLDEQFKEAEKSRNNNNTSPAREKEQKRQL